MSQDGCFLSHLRTDDFVQSAGEPAESEEETRDFRPRSGRMKKEELTQESLQHHLSQTRSRTQRLSQGCRQQHGAKGRVGRSVDSLPGKICEGQRKSELR